MNYLEKTYVYLSGPIEFDNDNYNWREEPKQILYSRFGINVFDPFADPKQQWKKNIEESIKVKDIDNVVKIAKSFVRKDLHTVDKSDFLIAYLPYKVPTTGTHHEVINANNSKKPTLLVTDQNDITKIPLWYFGFISPEFMFPNWNALYDYLEKVNLGECRNNNRWTLVYKEI